jgi:hypothetical protein
LRSRRCRTTSSTSHTSASDGDGSAVGLHNLACFTFRFADNVATTFVYNPVLCRHVASPLPSSASHSRRSTNTPPRLRRYRLPLTSDVTSHTPHSSHWPLSPLAVPACTAPSTSSAARSVTHAVDAWSYNLHINDDDNSEKKVRSTATATWCCGERRDDTHVNQQSTPPTAPPATRTRLCAPPAVRCDPVRSCPQDCMS